MNDLKERTLRGGVAKVFAQGANLFLRLGSLMVLARLLDPKDFGLVGMVTAITGVFNLFKDAGLSMATVQQETITEKQVSTLFWMNMVLGVMLGLLSFAIAPLLVSFFQEPRLFWVTVAIGAGFLFNAAGVQHSALLQRNMRFATLAAIDSISLLVSIVVGISMAIAGFGYWALVAMTAVLPVASTISLWLSTLWVPGWPHRGVGIRSMMRFGGRATLNGLIMYTAYNLEKILLGRYWGAEVLGVYDRAFQMISMPSANLHAATGGVLFSALSRLQNDPDRFKRYFLKSYSLTFSITLPITIGCVLFADEIILLFLGPKWVDAVIIFRLLAPTVVALALITPTYWLLVALGLARRSLRIALVLGPLMIVSYCIGLPYGSTGVALAYSAVMILWVVPHLAWCLHGTMISLGDIWRSLSRPLFSATLAAVLVLTVQLLYGQLVPPLPRLIVGCGGVLLVYGWILLCVLGQKAFYLDLLESLNIFPVLFGKRIEGKA